MTRKLRFVGYGVLLAGLLAIWSVVRRPLPADDELFSPVPTHRLSGQQATYDKIAKLSPLFPPLPKPVGGDWLWTHPEGGQTFDDYFTVRDVPICERYSEIHLVALGNFTKAQSKLLEQTQDFLARFYGMPVRTLEPVSLADLPPEAQRPRDDGKSRQLLTTWLMNDVLRPRRTDEAAALLGFVAEDLWCGDGWNWVNGQGSLTERVGVWSLFRNGNSEGDENEYRLCLLRTLKTAAHETGHLFGMPHCTAYACCMNGSNHRGESDRKPLEFCPECQAKLWWTCRLDPRERYRRLIEFSDDAGLTSEANFWRKLSDALLERKDD